MPEEILGPVVPISTFRTEAEAVALVKVGVDAGGSDDW